MERIVTRVRFDKPNIPKPKRVAAYARVSSGKDAMLHSLSAQVSYYSNLIQNHNGWEYAGVYADEALTGTKDNRDNFQRLLSDCRDGKIDMVITKSISRFARNTVTLLKTVHELKDLGVDVYFEEENIHSTDATGELILSFLAGRAQEESLSASENQKWRVRQNFQNGKPSKVWHSNSKYRRTIWQCNAKFKGEKKCTTPHLYEDDIKKCFVTALSQLITDREALLDDGRMIMRELKDTTAIDTECEQLIQEMDVVTELIKKCVNENTTQVIDQEEYISRYNLLVERHEKLQSRYDYLKRKKERRLQQFDRMSYFVFAVIELDELELQFNPALWHTTVDHVTVYADERLVFHFKNGSEVEVRL